MIDLTTRNLYGMIFFFFFLYMIHHDLKLIYEKRLDNQVFYILLLSDLPFLFLFLMFSHYKHFI